MGRLYCHCLNTKIGHSNELDHARVIQIEQLCPNVPKQLAGKELIEIRQDIGGVIMEHSTLSQVYAVNDWNVHHCSNCSTDIYLSHSVKQDKLYAFRNLIVDPSNLMQSSQYSQMFGIVLQDNEQELELMPRKRLSSMNYGREDPVLKLVHSRMKMFLNQQEELMEQRIKKFEEQQRRQFIQLQKHAHEERRRLFEAIYKSRESGITEAMLDQSNSKLENKPTSPVIMGFDAPLAAKSKNATITNKPQSISSAVPIRQHETKKEMDSNSDDMDDEAGMFTFDEEMKQPLHYQVKATDVTPFGLSSDDDDDSSTDGSSFHDDPVIRREVPSSLPMTMPMFMRHREEEYVGSIDENQIDPSEVAKSIQQLALSVQDTGMFGDLPKPRINSRRS